MILAILVPLPSALGQDEQKPQYVPQYVLPRHIFGDEASRLLKVLASSPQIPVSFENADRSPLTIVAASVSAVSFQKPGGSTITASADTRYALDAEITVVNKTDRRTKALKLEFTYENLRTWFELEDRIAIEPNGSSVFGEQQSDLPELISLPMMPGQLSVKVLEVKFEDGTIWEVDSLDVDETPVPLTRPQTTYTEEALRNRIQGSVRLRLLVSADGEVRNLKIIQGLPDGLDAEAVQTAYRLKFKPAMKAGEPVECWQLFEIEYKSPGRPGLTEIVSPKPNLKP
jgi:TonB family protein